MNVYPAAGAGRVHQRQRQRVAVRVGLGRTDEREGEEAIVVQLLNLREVEEAMEWL